MYVCACVCVVVTLSADQLGIFKHSTDHYTIMTCAVVSMLRLAVTFDFCSDQDRIGYTNH